MDHIKNEFGNVCHGCLSQDRRILPLAEYTDIFNAIININSASCTNTGILEAKMCFECLAILKRMKQFQEQVALAQETLEHMYYVDAQIDLKTLSKLRICNPVDIQNHYEYLSMEETKEEPSTQTTNSIIIRLEKLTDLNVKRHSSQDIQINTPQDIQSHLPKDTRRQSLRNLRRIEINTPQDIQSHLPKDTRRQSLRNLRRRLPQDIQKSSSKDLQKSSSQDIQRYSPQDIDLPQDIDNYSPVSSPSLGSDNEWKPPESLKKELPASDGKWVDFDFDYELTLKKKETTQKESNNQTQPKKKRHSEVRFESKLVDIKETNISLKKYSEYFTQVFLNEQELQSLYDRNKIFLKIEKMNCNECSAEFSTKGELLRHRTLNHFKNGSFECLVCKNECPNLETLKTHVLTHAKYFKCNLCGLHFARVRDDHIKIYHTKIYICKKCGETLHSAKDFLKHCEMYHEVFICDYCDKRKLSRRLIIKHIKRYHGTKHKCKICQKVYKKFNTLRNHMAIQHHKLEGKDKELAYCVECDKQFPNIRKFRQHVKSTIKHTKKKVTFPCPGCDKVFGNITYMKNHYQHVHNQGNAARPYCKICDKVKDILINHQRTHTGERPFKCEYCSAAFAQKVAMVYHQKKHAKT